MKHYNEDPICCYPLGNITEKCKNCAKYIENKLDGEYVLTNYQTSGKAFVKDNSEAADVYRDCCEGNNFMMYEVFDDGETPKEEPTTEAVKEENHE